MMSRQFNVGQFLTSIYDNPVIVPYWYLYAFIPYLLSLPFLRSMVRSMEHYHYRYLITIYFAFNCAVPIFEFLLFNNAHALNRYLRATWLTTNIIIYPIMGYYIDIIFDIRQLNRNKLIRLWMLNIGMILVSCILTYSLLNKTGKFNQSFLGTFDLFNMLTVFITFKYAFFCYELRMGEKVKAMIMKIGACTFGIYLWHIMILSKLPYINHVWNKLIIMNLINPMILAFGMCALVFFIGVILTAIMKQFPVLKHLV